VGRLRRMREVRRARDDVFELNGVEVETVRRVLDSLLYLEGGRADRLVGWLDGRLMGWWAGGRLRSRLFPWGA